MIDNGIYSGIYTDDPSFQAPTFIDTFTLIVINNYAVAGQDSRLKRTISQLKYAVDAITNQATVKQRTKTDGSDWTEWKEIGGGGSNEVDITDAVKAYGLPTLIEQGFAKEGVTYIVNCFAGQAPLLDKNNKIALHLSEIMKSLDDLAIMKIKFFKDNTTSDWNVFFDTYITGYGYVNYFEYCYNNVSGTVKVSADMTTL